MPDEKPGMVLSIRLDNEEASELIKMAESMPWPVTKLAKRLIMKGVTGEMR